MTAQAAARRSRRCAVENTKRVEFAGYSRAAAATLDILRWPLLRAIIGTMTTERPEPEITPAALAATLSNIADIREDVRAIRELLEEDGGEEEG